MDNTTIPNSNIFNEYDGFPEAALATVTAVKCKNTGNHDYTAKEIGGVLVEWVDTIPKSGREDTIKYFEKKGAKIFDDFSFLCPECQK